MKIFRLLLIVCILSVCLALYPQATQQEDKYTSVNIMVSKVTSTELGYIVQYYAGGKFRELYLPTRFFFNGLAVKVVEESPQIAPQMSIIYKNLAPLKVKLYMPSNPEGLQYPAIEFMPKDMTDKFNSTNKLDIQMKD